MRCEESDMRRAHKRKTELKLTSQIHVKIKRYIEVDNTKDIDLILAKGKLVQDLLGFSNEHLGRLFENAINLLAQHRFDEAILAFDLLTQFNPYISDFWVGFGLAHQANQNFLQALSAYLVAQTMDPSRLDAYSYAIECCFEMKNFDQAEAIIQEAFAYAKKHPRDDDSTKILKEMHLFQKRLISEKNHKPTQITE